MNYRIINELLTLRDPRRLKATAHRESPLVLGRLGAILLGALWGRFWDGLGTVLGRSWGGLGASWGVLAAKTDQERGESEF